MVQVQSSWFPVIDRNPQTFCNIYEAEESDFQKALHRVHHSQTHASYIDLKTLREELCGLPPASPAHSPVSFDNPFSVFVRFITFMVNLNQLDLIYFLKIGIDHPDS